MVKYATFGAVGLGGLLVISAVALAFGSDKVEPVSNGKDLIANGQLSNDRPKVVEKPVDKPKEKLPRTDPALQVGGIKFAVKPANARITIDGNAVGSPDQPQFLKIGSHKYVAEAAGYFPEEAEVAIVEGKVQEISLALKPRPVQPKGTVEINCQPWCRISVDGRDTGKTSPARVVVNAGTRVLQLTNPPAGLAKTITLKVPENGTVKQVVKLED